MGSGKNVGKRSLGDPKRSIDLVLGNRQTAHSQRRPAAHRTCRKAGSSVLIRMRIGKTEFRDFFFDRGISDIATPICRRVRAVAKGGDCDLSGIVLPRREP